MSAVAGQTPDKKGNNVLVVDDFALSVINAAVSHNDLLKAGFMSAWRARRATPLPRVRLIARRGLPDAPAPSAHVRARCLPRGCHRVQPSARWRPRSSWPTA
jgi:hypothetical protein